MAARRILLTFLFPLVCSPLFAVQKGNFTSLAVGAYMDNIEQRYKAPPGQGALVSRIAGVARLRRGFHLGKSWHFEPSFATVLPWESGVDGTALLFTFHAGFDLGIPIFSFLRLRLGPGIRWHLFVVSGGVVTLNNGQGTADFYTPSNWKNSFLLTGDGGLEVVFSQRLSLLAEVFTSSLFSSARRSTHAALSLAVTL